MQLAPRRETKPVEQVVGTVQVVETGGGRELVAVLLEAGCVMAARAPSCLLQPQAGDRVLVARTPDAAYVLGVLERDRSLPARVVIEGDAQVGARGKLTLSGEAGVTILTEQVLALASQALEVHAATGSIVVGGLKAMVGTVDAVLERISQRVKRAYRFVEEMEHVRAGGLDYAARENVRLHGKNALVTAQALVKVDGAQIHMG